MEAFCPSRKWNKSSLRRVNLVSFGHDHSLFPEHHIVDFLHMLLVFSLRSYINPPSGTARFITVAQSLGSMNQNFHPVHNVPTWPFDLARLLAEKDFLENGLANCVTYLHALRKKQARNERRLTTDPSLPRKKRKKIQQSKSELEREIENREGAERAFLNNLLACNANIYIAETFSWSSTNLSSTVPDHNSASTVNSFAAESEPTESSWTGWTDDAAVSPFQKHSNKPFFATEFAPDESSAGLEIDPRPSHLHIEDDGAVLPVPPNTAQPQYLYSTLSANAVAFDPCATITSHRQAPPGQHVNGLNISPSSTINGQEHMRPRRVTDAGLSRNFRQLSLRPQLQPSEVRRQTWCVPTPQRSPVKDIRSGVLRGSRTDVV